MLGFALLGCGRIGALHAATLGRLAETQLVCVHDPDPAAAGQLAKRHGVATAASVADAIAAPGVDAVLVGTSTNTHADCIEAAAKAGKAVFCEKPIDISLARVMACRRILAQHPVPVQIGFNRRFDRGHAAARAALRGGEIGDLLHMVCTNRVPVMPPREYYLAAGGYMRDSNIHDFDLARFFLGEEPVEVFAVAGRLCDPQLMEEIDDHDSAMIILRTASGRLCHINSARSAVYGFDQRIELHGSAGLLLSGNRRPHATQIFTAAGTARRSPLEHHFMERYLPTFELEIASFAAAVRQDTPVQVSFDDGVRALQLAEAAYESVRREAMVAVPSLPD